MRLLDVLKSEDNIRLDKKTLVVLRWIAIGGQFTTINFVYFVLNFNFPFIFCLSVIFLGAITNFFLQFRNKNKLLSGFNSSLYLTYDLTQLAILVFLTGGIKINNLIELKYSPLFLCVLEASATKVHAKS